MRKKLSPGDAVIKPNLMLFKRIQCFSHFALPLHNTAISMVYNSYDAVFNSFEGLLLTRQNILNIGRKVLIIRGFG